MSAILWILIGGALIGGGYFAYRKSQQSGGARKELPSSPSRTLMTLQVNDIVTHFDTDYIVEGKLTFREDGSEWVKALLADGGEQVWLSVEDKDGLVAGLSRAVDELSFTSRPPELITHGGHKYQLEKWGKAEVVQVGETATKRGKQCTYFEYKAPGGKSLSVEEWGEGSYEVLLGEEALAHAFEILPGDEVD